MKNVQTTFFRLRFLPQTPHVLMCIKCMNVTRTKCLVIMEKVFKSQIFGSFGTLIEHGPHWINFNILTFISEKKKTLEAYIKFEKKLFHLT